MKRSITNHLLLLALVVGVGFSFVERITAQAFNVVQYFMVGANPIGALTQFGDTFYVANGYSGSIPLGNGALFKVSLAGAGFAFLYSFTNSGD